MERTSNFTERFNSLMENTTVTQASDFLGIGKATVSSYMSGARTAKASFFLCIAKASFLQRIADAYGVDVLWLMGYDVPKYKEEAPDVSVEGMSEDRAQLIQVINQMSDDQV